MTEPPDTGPPAPDAQVRPPALSRQIPVRGERIAIKLFVPLAVLLAAIVIVFWVAFDTAVVVGDSMVPTLVNGEYLLVTKGYRVPVRGDIVNFHEPGPSGGTIDVIKRVTAVAGDSVGFSNGHATINGSPEPPHPGIYDGTTTYRTIAVPPGTVFVLGDNRPVSLDSRIRGPIPLSLVQGRAVAVFLPIWRIRLLNR
jgi:signal peptidase I